MKKPLISIITVCKDQVYMERTCLSIVNQTFKNFEWIVIDGNSTDEDSINILSKYKDKMSVFVSEPDKGIYDAMNKGIVLSKGYWLIFMNGGDCFYDKDVLWKIFYRKKYKKIDLLYGSVEKKGQNLYPFIASYPFPLTSDYFLNIGGIHHQATFIKRKLFFKYGFYDLTYKLHADAEMWKRLFFKKCIFYPLNVVVGTFHLDSKSANTVEQKYLENEKIYSKYCNDTNRRYKLPVSFSIIYNEENFLSKLIKKILSKLS